MKKCGNCLHSAANANEENFYIRRALEYIHNNYSNSIKIAEIAEYVCIDRSYLYTLFRKNLNLSPQDYLTNYRITHAAELLSLTDLPVGGVALSCNHLLSGPGNKEILFWG